mgnify:CR=1 FL=1
MQEVKKVLKEIEFGDAKVGVMVETPAAVQIIEDICPVGSQVLVDEDDGYPPEGHSRIIGVVHCNDVLLNKELLDTAMGYLSDRFCDSSEFASSSWAQRHGCRE